MSSPHRRRTALIALGIVAGATLAAIVVGRLLAPTAPHRRAPEVAPAGPPVAAQARWVVDLGPGLTAPDRIIHPPQVVGDRVLIAGARIGYAALDVATGGVAWRRPASPDLAAPLVLAPHDVIEVSACGEPIGVPPEQAVVACFARIDPLDIAARSAGAIVASVADAAPCLASTAPWRITGTAAAIELRRDGCALAVTLPDGHATALTPDPPAPTDEPGADCATTADGTRWCQRVDGGASTVEVAGVRVPGLAVLAAASDGARAVVVVRRDATLRHDDAVGIVDGRVAWTWRLPEPARERATPVAASLAGGAAYLVFDSTRVAAIAPP